jgi:GTPase Era involved in 16S rRNA processing
MLARTFEINVALLGNVSAGKTTILNALFRDKYGEVAMKRTTVGANYFHIHSKKTSTAQEKIVDGAEQGDNRSEWLKEVKDPRSAGSILQEITEDNSRITDANVDSVQEKHFDVELDDDIIPMAKDTRLVFIDIPGINEAGTDNKYKDYVSKHWHTFDCVLLVMDGKHDVRTDDQMFILKFVKENLVKRKMPIIILCNKIDYISEEQEELIRITREQVEEIFCVKSRDQALRSVFESSHRKRTFHEIQEFSPLSISISAVQAYIFQTASQMEFEKFQAFDKNLIEEFGRELVGRVQWWKLSDSAKVRQVYDILRDPTYCQRGLKECNFDKLLFVLNFFLGGEHLQGSIVEEQINVAINALRTTRNDRTDITLYARSAYEKLRLLNSKTKTTTEGELKTTFWNAYKALEGSRFDQLKVSAQEQNVHVLKDPMDQLILYYSLSSDAEWRDEMVNAINAMKALVRRLIGWVLASEKNDVRQPWIIPNENSNQPSLFDWGLIKGSILLLSYNRYFVESFGREKVMTETLCSTQTMPTIDMMSNCRHCARSLQQRSKSCKSCESCRYIFFFSLVDNDCPNCEENIHYGDCQCGYYSFELYSDQINLEFDSSTKRLTAVEMDLYKKFVHVEIPELLSDPSHFGHIIWKYCEFMETIDKKA